MVAPLRHFRKITSTASTSKTALGIALGRQASRTPKLDVIPAGGISTATSSKCRPVCRRVDVASIAQRRRPVPVGRVASLQGVRENWKSLQCRGFSAEAAASHGASGSNGPSPLFGDEVIVTKRCAERILELRESKSIPGLRLRLTVEGGGCSGFQYKFALEDTPTAGEAAKEEALEDDSDDEDDGDADHEFERNGAVLVVDETSLEFVKGATVDFEENMMRSAFAVVNNPVSESACGCGSSFAIKNFEKNPALD